MNESSSSPEQLKQYEQAGYKIMRWWSCFLLSLFFLLSAIIRACFEECDLGAVFLLLLALYFKPGKKNEK